MCIWYPHFPDSKPCDAQLLRLQNQMARLRDENRKYREANRAAEFEAAAKQLREQLAATEAEKVKALQEVHELKMKLRKNDGEFTSGGKRYVQSLRSGVSLSGFAAMP